jgi:glycine dehydrogenase subunit 2
MGEAGAILPPPTAAIMVSTLKKADLRTGRAGHLWRRFRRRRCGPAPALGKFLRKAAPALPGLTEPEVVRHYTRLSRQNYAIDLGPFPLGSCTMKHNPRLNEKVARMAGLPTFTRCSRPDGAGRFESHHAIGRLADGADRHAAVAMTPKAGAHGELCGCSASAPP